MDYKKRLEAIALKNGVLPEELLKQIPEVNTNESYDDMLDDCHEMVKICGYEYYPSDAFEKVDPIAYRCGYLDYIDSREKDGEWISFDNGDTYYLVEDIERLLGEAEGEDDE